MSGVTATLKRWRGPGGKILRAPNGKRYVCEECPCEDGPTLGVDCPTFCQAGTTPAEFDATFSGIVNNGCGSAAYYNATFRFVQDAISPCKFNISNGSGDTWAGPCGLGTTVIQFVSGRVELNVSEVGGAVFFRFNRSNGDPCTGPFTLPYHSAAGAPSQLTWTAASVTIVPV